MNLFLELTSRVVESCGVDFSIISNTHPEKQNTLLDRVCLKNLFFN